MVITPDESLCPADTRKYFRKLIRGAIDVETYDDPLNEPRWLIARKDNVILYGVAIMLEIFGTDCCTDFTGRNVRGFFGIVVDVAVHQLHVLFQSCLIGRLEILHGTDKLFFPSFNLRFLILNIA